MAKPTQKVGFAFFLFGVGMETIAIASKICIRLREPKDAYIEGDKARPAEDGSGMLVENARLAHSIATTPLGRLVLVPYENIVYVTLEE